MLDLLPLAAPEEEASSRTLLRLHQSHSRIKLVTGRSATQRFTQRGYLRRVRGDLSIPYLYSGKPGPDTVPLRITKRGLTEQ